MNGLGHLAKGYMALTREEIELSIGAALDPTYAQFQKNWLGMSCLLDGQLQEAEEIFESLFDFSKKRGKIDGEHKQVIVKFCDKEESTPLVEKLGSEEIFHHGRDLGDSYPQGP